MLSVVLMLSAVMLTKGFQVWTQPRVLQRSALSMITKGEAVPSNIMVNLVESSNGGEYEMKDKMDLGAALKSHKKAVLFAVPGAFTPTCSLKHLPGFVAKAADLRSKGVEAIYCLSVNDKFVMKAWAEATEGAAKSGIKFVADGNADFTRALNLVKDASGGGMGVRCTRFASIVENGVFTQVAVDEQGFEGSSVENMLSLL